MVRRMKVERNTAVRSTATARRSGTVGVAAAQVVSGHVVAATSTNQGSLTVSDLPSLNPTPPQFLLSPGQQSYLTTSGNMAQLAPMQQQLQPQQQQQHILLSNMNEMPAQKLIRHGHQLELLTEAKILCDRQDFVDLTIYCEDGVVRAHQMLLAVASPFLMLLFQSNPSYENEDITLILPEVKACLVQALIHFVYTGVVVSNENHFYSLMKLVYALNINASIEAESTNDRATTFTAPLVAPSSLSQVLRLPQQQINPLLQQQNLLPQQLLPQQPVPMHQSINGSVSTASSSNVNAVAAAAVAAITQPAIAPPNLVPSTSKAARLSGPPSNAIPVPLQNLGQTTPSKLPIQLPTQPVPLVNGVVRGTEQSGQHLVNNVASAPTQQYIAIDPITGINYKVDMSLSSEVGSDPLAAIMNETIFQDTSGAIVPAPNAQIYQTDNGQVIYTTQPPPNATATIPTSMQIQQPLTSSPVQSGKRGKKRGAAVKQEGGGGSPLNNNSPVISNTVPASILSSVQIVGDQSVDDLPCTPDDEDINTPYPCPSCNKTIKGKVMLQAHHFQEHYDNPELNQVDIGDKHACRVCLKLFTRNSDVKAHILRVHCGDRRYPCTMCGKRFKESTHLRKHLYTHTGERPHFCSLCSKGFQTSSDLKRHKRTRVHQERVEQGGGMEPENADSPPSTPVVVAAAASVARKSAPVAITAASCDVAATSSITNTSITSADGSLSATTTRWSDDEEMNEVENASSDNASSANAAQVILNSITEPVAMVGSEDVSGQLIVPTTTSAAGGTITDAADSIVHVGHMVSVPSTTTSVNWSGSGGGIVTTNASSSPSASTPLDLKELTSASDMSAFIESATENIASAAPSASTSNPGSVVSLTAAHAPLIPSLDDASTSDAMHVKMEVQTMEEHNDNGMRVQAIDDVLMASDPGSNEEHKTG